MWHKMACLKFCGAFLVIIDCSCHLFYNLAFTHSNLQLHRLVNITTMAPHDKKTNIQTVLAFDCFFVLSIHLVTVCVCLCACLCSILQFIPQFSPDCEDCGGVPVELPVKAGLAILQVSPNGWGLKGFFQSVQKV